MLSSYWIDVFPTRRTTLPPAYCSENSVNVISLRAEEPFLISECFSEKNLGKRSSYTNLVLHWPKWKNKEEVMNGDEELGSSKLARSRKASHNDFMCH